MVSCQELDTFRKARKCSSSATVALAVAGSTPCEANGSQVEAVILTWQRLPASEELCTELVDAAQVLPMRSEDISDLHAPFSLELLCSNSMHHTVACAHSHGGQNIPSLQTPSSPSHALQQLPVSRPHSRGRGPLARPPSSYTAPSPWPF